MLYNNEAKMNDINIIDLMMEFPLDIVYGNSTLLYNNGEWIIVSEYNGEKEGEYFSSFNEAILSLVYD
jgi:hypothetical protein